MSETVKAFVLMDKDDPGEIREIENTLEAFQEIVGGYIETFTCSADVTLVINEDGRLLDLPVNRDFCGHRFVGPMIFVGYNDEGEFTDLPEEDLRCLETWGDWLRRVR